MTILLYLAKPRIGGWISFTAHLSLLKDYKIYRLSKRTETKDGKPKLRDFGYSCNYQNITTNYHNFRFGRTYTLSSPFELKF